MNAAAASLHALRPRQWTKNLLLLVPVFFAKSAFNTELLTRSVVGFVAFCALASGVYLANDWVDRDKDRLHPEKKLRPIAAGHLSGRGVLLLLAACWLVAAGLSWWVGPAFAGVAFAYVVLQALYTPLLKRLVILDVMAIALGFILRVVAGGQAIPVEVSNWLLLCTLLGAIFLGFAKRRHELSSVENASAHRANLDEYSVPLLDQMMSISAACTILAYGLYTVSKETVDHVGSDRLKFTVPCVIYGIFRYLFLVYRKNLGGSPERVLLSDAPLIADLAVFVAVAGWALYFR